MTAIDLPDTIPLPPSKTRHNLAIASTVLYGIFLLITWLVEYRVIWKNWSSKRRRRNCCRVSVEVFIDFISLLCMIRIIGNALYLSSPTPTRSVFVVQTLFASLGFLPMLMKLVLVLRRIISKGHDQRPLHMIKRSLIAVRIGLFIGVILIIVGASVLLLDLWKAGATILLVVFVCLSFIHVVLLVYTRREGIFSKVQRKGLLVATTALPPLVVRAVYLILIQFSHSTKLNPITGDPAYLIGMGYAMEFLVITSLLAATALSEELPWSDNKADHGKLAVQDDSEDVKQKVTV